MTLSTEAFKLSYNGDGAQTAFAVTFPFFQNAHVEAILRDANGTETVWEQGIDYTLSGGEGAAGTLTATVAPATGEVLVIRRDVPLTQETDYPEGGPFPSASHEDALDFARMVDQQQQEQLDRAFKVPASDPVTSVGEHPKNTDRANKLAAYSGDGRPTVSSKTLAEVEATVNAATSGSGVTDAASVTYTPAGAGAVDRNVRDVLRQGVSVLDFIPIAEQAAIRARTSTYDTYANIVSADEYAESIGAAVFFPPGTYRINDDFRHKDGSGIKSKGFIGAGPDVTILEFDVSVADARLLTAAGTYNVADTRFRGQKLSAPSPDTELAQLNGQESLNNTVTLTAAADSSKFAIGDWVTVSCGHDPYDANSMDDGGGTVGNDNGLWRYSMVTRIAAIDGGTGKITLADAIQQPLTDDGFAPASARNMAADWANSTAYSVGNLVNDPTDNPANSLWEAATAGTSSGTSPRDDTGVAWLERSSGIGSEKGFVDGRPVIQKLRNARNHVTLRDFTYTNIGTVPAGGIDFRNCYGCVAENIVGRGNIETVISATEGSFNMRFSNVLDMADRRTNNRGFGAYAAHNVLVEACTLSGSGIGGETVFIEANADVIFRNTVFNAVRDIDHFETGILMSHGTVAVEGCKFFGYTVAITQNEALSRINPTRKDVHRLATIRQSQGNHFEFSAAGMRRMWSFLTPNQAVQTYSPGNTYRFEGNVTSPFVQTDPVIFEPTRLVEYVFSFTPLASQVNAAIALPSVPDQGIFDIEDIRALLLGCRVKWDSAPVGGVLDVRPLGSDGSNSRNLLGLTGAQNAIQVSDTQPTAQLFKSDGANIRFIDNRLPNGGRERLSFVYFSNASSAGGTVYVTMVLLVEEGHSGDFEG